MMVVASEMGCKPHDGSIYLFRNGTRDKLKALVWERNGFFLGYKRLERGRFEFPKSQEGHIQMGLEQLYCLISGLPFKALETGSKVTHFF